MDETIHKYPCTTTRPPSWWLGPSNFQVALYIFYMLYTFVGARMRRLGAMLPHLQSIPCEDQIIYPSKVQRGQTHCPMGTTSIGGIMHAMCQPLEHLSHTNIWATPPLDPHNIHVKLAGITTKLGSIVPSTFGRWHGAQLCTWSF
jgi:hypothetical protein